VCWIVVYVMGFRVFMFFCYEIFMFYI
jgi:hypothetical protein